MEHKSPELDPQKWAEIIEDELRYWGKDPGNAPHVKTAIVVNPDRTRFLMLDTGWYHDDYVNDVIVHLEIAGDKILVHRDNAGDANIVAGLKEAGVPQERIVWPSQSRPETPPKIKKSRKKLLPA